MSNVYIVDESAQHKVRKEAAQFLELHVDADDTDDTATKPITFEAHPAGEDQTVTVVFIANAFARLKGHEQSTKIRGEVRIKGEEDAPKRGLLLIGRGAVEHAGYEPITLEVLDETDLPVY